MAKHENIGGRVGSTSPLERAMVSAENAQNAARMLAEALRDLMEQAPHSVNCADSSGGFRPEKCDCAIGRARAVLRRVEGV